MPKESQQPRRAANYLSSDFAVCVMEGKEVISWIPWGAVGQQVCSRLRAGFWRLQNVIGTDSSLRPLSHKGQDGTVSNTEHWRPVKSYVQCCRGVKDGLRIHQSVNKTPMHY